MSYINFKSILNEKILVGIIRENRINTMTFKQWLNKLLYMEGYFFLFLIITVFSCLFLCYIVRYISRCTFSIEREHKKYTNIGNTRVLMFFVHSKDHYN